LKGLLGVGAFGVVVLVKNRVTEQPSALKIINKMRLSEHSIEVLKNESIILQSLNHENIVKFKQIFETNDYVIIEMEYVKGG
jgi:serine/threonine protein kinase